MSLQLKETKDNLLAEIGLDEHDFPLLENLQVMESRYLRDLKINVSNCLNYESIGRKHALLLAYGVALNDKCLPLIESFSKMAADESASEAELTEMVALVSQFNVNNVFYRFRHFSGKDYYNQTPAGLRMSFMSNPVLGKEFFELASLVISAINGCEVCVRSHEEAVLRQGSSEARVMDAIRLGSVIKGLTLVVQK